MFSAALLVLAAAASPALATIYVTAPVASTSWVAGQPQTISWKDDGQAPALSSFGPSKVSVYVGNAIQQTSVQEISGSVDVSTTSSIVFTPDASTGENGQYYFIRFESLSTKDPNNAAYPALSFSPKYTMSGMTGAFTVEEKAQIASTVNPGLGNTAAPTSSSSSSSSASKTSAATGKTSGTSSAPSSSGTAAGAQSNDNGASALPISAMTCAAGVAIAVFSAMFM